MAKKKRKVPAKPSGEIGITKLSSDQSGEHHAELLRVSLPSSKEGLEAYIADRFVDNFNAQAPFGKDVQIFGVSQPHESGLDFGIECTKASILELAEIAPISEEFGKEAQDTGRYHIYEMSRWVWQKVIQRKQAKYGDLNSEIFLLLYTTFWQFHVGDAVLNNLRSSVQRKGCRFSGVFFLYVGGEGENALNHISVVHPYTGPQLPHPREQKRINGEITNFPPGQSIWEIPQRLPLISKKP